MNNKEVTVIIPHYNRLDTIGRALNSVLLNYEFVYQTIIVDDNSEPDIKNALYSICKSKKYEKINITIIENESNLNAAYSRNVGIDNTESKYIAFLDSDDEWEAGKLGLQIKSLVDCDIIYSQISVVNTGKVVGVFPKKPFSGNVARYLLEDNGHIQTSTMFMLTETAKKVKFDSSLKKYQDWNFAIKLSAEGYKFKLVKEPLVNYYVDANNRIGNNMSERLLTEFVSSIEQFVEPKVLKRFKAYTELYIMIQNKHLLKAAINLLDLSKILIIGFRKYLQIVGYYIKSVGVTILKR